MGIWEARALHAAIRQNDQHKVRGLIAAGVAVDAMGEQDHGSPVSGSDR